MKRLVLVITIFALVLSFGTAGAADSTKIPQNLQDAYTNATGTQANFAIWFPIVPEMSSLSWSNILIVSNFNNFSIAVQCWFTDYSNEQTQKTYALPFFGKKIITLSDAGFGDSLYDVYCLSNQLFGAAVLLVENGSIATTWPPLFMY